MRKRGNLYWIEEILTIWDKCSICWKQNMPWEIIFFDTWWYNTFCEEHWNDDIHFCHIYDLDKAKNILVRISKWQSSIDYLNELYK